jgi:hypothetical protein
MIVIDDIGDKWWLWWQWMVTTMATNDDCNDDNSSGGIVEWSVFASFVAMACKRKELCIYIVLFFIFLFSSSFLQRIL